MRAFTPGERGHWFNMMAQRSRPVTIVKVSKRGVVVRTDDGHTYSAHPAVVSRQPVDLTIT